VGKVKEHEAHIKLIENKYITKKPYRCSIPDQKEIEFQISNLLNAGLIEESSSPFAAPVTLAFKREEGKKTKKEQIGEDHLDKWTTITYTMSSCFESNSTAP